MFRRSPKKTYKKIRPQHEFAHYVEIRYHGFCPRLDAMLQAKAEENLGKLDGFGCLLCGPIRDIEFKFPKSLRAMRFFQSVKNCKDLRKVLVEIRIRQDSTTTYGVVVDTGKDVRDAVEAEVNRQLGFKQGQKKKGKR